MEKAFYLVALIFCVLHASEAIPAQVTRFKEIAAWGPSELPAESRDLLEDLRTYTNDEGYSSEQQTQNDAVTIDNARKNRQWIVDDAIAKPLQMVVDTIALYREKYPQCTLGREEQLIRIVLSVEGDLQSCFDVVSVPVEKMLNVQMVTLNEDAKDIERCGRDVIACKVEETCIAVGMDKFMVSWEKFLIDNTDFILARASAVQLAEEDVSQCSNTTSTALQMKSIQTDILKCVGI